jgi:hypothetical protein
LIGEFHTYRSPPCPRTVRGAFAPSPPS